MRTTLEIDDDVLLAAKELAAQEKTTAGRIISRVFRRGMQTAGETAESGLTLKNGIPVLPIRGELITSAHIQRLMEEEGI